MNDIKKVDTNTMSNRTSRAKAREKRNAGLNVETNDETNDETNAETNAETTVQPNPVENTNSNPGVRLSVGTFVVESWKIMCVSVGPLVAAYFSTSTKVMIAVNLGYTFLKMLQSIAAKPKKKAPLQYVWSLLKFGSFYSILSGVVNTVKVNVKEIAAASFVAGYGMHDIVTLLNPFAWLKADFPEPMFPGPMAVLFNQRWDHAGAFPRMEKEFGAHGGGDLSSFDPKTKSWFQYIIKRVIYQQKVGAFC